MNEFEKLGSSEDTLDSILNEIKNFSSPAHSASKAGEGQAASSGRKWSMEDIDRLIADTVPATMREEKAPVEAPTQPPKQPEPIVVKEIKRFPDEDVPVSSYFKKTAKQFREESRAAQEESGEAQRADEAETKIDDILAFELRSRKAAALQEAKPASEEPLTIVPAAPEQPKEEVGQPAKSSARKVESFVINEPQTGRIVEPQELFDAAEKRVQPQTIDPDGKIPDYNPLDIYEKQQKEKESVIETDASRKSFLTPLRLERTAEIEEDLSGPIDKPGILLEKSRRQMTAGLEPMPTVISADKALSSAGKDLEKTLVAGSSAKSQSQAEQTEEFPGQLKLTGFEDISSDASPEKVEENIVEADLLAKRKQKAIDFKIVPIDGDDGLSGAEIIAEPLTAKEKKKLKAQQKKQREAERNAGIEEPEEYTDRSKRRAVHTALSLTEKRYGHGIIIGAAVELALIFVFFLPRILEAASISSSLFGAGEPGIYVTNAVLLIVAIAANSTVFSSGLSKLFKKLPDGDSAVALSAAVAFVHNTVAAVVESESVGKSPVFPAVAVLGFIAVNIAGKLNAQRMLSNFELCAYKYDKNLYAVHPLEVEAEILELSRGLLMDRAELLYSSKADFPADFIKNSHNSAIERKTAGLLIPVAAVAGVVTGVVSFLLAREWLTALNVACGTFCVCSPMFASLVPAAAMRAAGKELNKDGSMLSGCDSAEKIAAANGVVIDSADIFDRSQCCMHGMIDFKKIRIDDVLVYAAAMVIKAGGPLKESFEQVISRDHNLLPQVKELAYEDKLGISARIHSQKVLLGCRSLLEHHGVEMPERSIEDKYIKTGKKVIYLAVKGQLAAMFVVGYAVDENLGEYLSRLEEAGTQILVRTNDVNVTEEQLAKGFKLPKSAFSVLGSVAGRLFKRRRDAVSDSISIDAAHNGTAFTMLRTVSAAQRLCKSLNALNALQTVMSILGFVMAAVLVGLSFTAWFNAMTAALFTAICLAVAFAVSSTAKPQ